MKHRTQMAVLLMAAGTATAVLVEPFTSWEDLTRKSPDIIIARCTTDPNPTVIGDGMIWSDIEVLTVLNGDTRPKAARMVSLYRPHQNERFLMFASYQSNQLYQAYQAPETYRIVPLARDFLTNALAGKSLDEQIRLVLRSRLEDVSRELESSAEEKKRLEEGLRSHRSAAAESTPTNLFAIYLFAEYQDWRDSPSNWTQRRLSPKPMISEADIVSYTFTNHLLTLTPEAAQRISQFRERQLVDPFVVVANGERIYRGAFVSSFCSMSVRLPTIELWGYLQFTFYTNLPPNSLLIERTFHVPFSKTEPDPRSDARIKRALDVLHKLK
jgi:hypothetical protein